ncbi:FAD-dependent monooxygenase [Hymenobacter properus]|uniref:FAD-dependent monooxygenase n=1 Tax=Hymenobacter properus TaxID=2791026 RepID=A0A931BFC5_9BACT|nr:FAD-dependent monooxygenase [Hymenobacter properus]MBF9140651.1 FAD-dependent monooxygenase [Hymenobacter properus]MBR7719459.1 FAD-dependent monooxygenase [Microvirga sp. SRT04]
MQSAINQPVYDVVIAGAGPVGLFLACELALARCSVLVLEKADSPHSPLKQLPLGLRGLNAPSVEALDRRGLLAELEVPKRLKTPHFAPTPSPGPTPRGGGHFAGIPIPGNKIDFTQWPERLPSSTSNQLFAEMAELETVLARRAETLGVSIMRGVAITGLSQTAAGVTLQGGGQAFAGQWLVGCDGGRSAVRKLAGFDFVGTEPEFTGYSLLVDFLDPEKLRPGRNVTPTGMYMQSQPGYLILQDFDGGAYHRAGQPISLVHVQELARRISGTDVTLTGLHLASTWTDRARQATAYRHGRVLLAGDAAHIHAPLGGQGLNLGLGDAMNLGWKLAATIHGQAPAGLLDSYQTERHPVGAKVLDWSRAQVAIMRPNPAAQALYAIMSDLMDTPDGATYFAGRIWGLRTHYDLGGTHPLVGHSAPNFALADGSTLGEHLRGGHGLLLDFEANADLASWASRFNGKLKYVAAPAAEQLGLRAVLVRPDGIVAWATECEPDVEELGQAAARWFMDKETLAVQMA